MPTCPEYRQAFRRKRLGQKQRIKINRHFARCDACRKKLMEFGLQFGPIIWKFVQYKEDGRLRPYTERIQMLKRLLQRQELVYYEAS